MGETPKTTLPHHRNCLGYTIKACLRRLKTLIFCAIDKNICLLIALKISINTWVQDVCIPLWVVRLTHPDPAAKTCAAVNFRSEKVAEAM